MTVLFFTALLFKESSLVRMSFCAGVWYCCCWANSPDVARLKVKRRAVNLFIRQSNDAGGETGYGMRKMECRIGKILGRGFLVSGFFSGVGENN